MVCDRLRVVLAVPQMHLYHSTLTFDAEKIACSPEHQVHLVVEVYFIASCIALHLLNETVGIVGGNIRVDCLGIEALGKR